MIRAYKDIHSIVSAIILSGGVPGFIQAWRLSQVMIMTTQFSHEIDALRLRLTAKVRFGNPTDISIKVSYPVIKISYNKKLLFSSSETDQYFNLNKGDELCFDLISAQILRQSIPDLFRSFQGKESVNFIAEIKSMIYEKIPLIRTVIIRI